MQSDYKAKLVVLEGTDGSGKSTQVEMIKKYFEERGLTYAFYHFPMYGHNYFSEAIAKFLRGEFGKADEVDPVFVATQYAMDRYKFLPELEKQLKEKNVVLLDRYIFSNIAFQCAKLKNPEERTALKNWIFNFEFNFLKLPYPDINIFFNVPLNVIEQRLNERKNEKRDYLKGLPDIHEEDINFQEKVRLNYLDSMNETLNCEIIECAIGGEILSPEDVFLSYKHNIDYVLDI